MSAPEGASSPSRTPLFALHESLGARFVPFAGFEMPIQFPTGIIREHTHTRTAAGLFDVSHMGQALVAGPEAARGLERLMPIDVVGLAPGRQRYALLTNESGGVLDDLMVANLGDAYLLVVNAACRDGDLRYLREHLTPEYSVTPLDTHGLLALQGPKAVDVLKRLVPVVDSMTFMDVVRAEIDGIECCISRSGYTGEDGFEISLPGAAAEGLARTLLEHEAVLPIGLGARDSLRLEAGLCLYGQDLDASTTPVEASLGWALSKARRPGGVRAGGYPGAAAIAAELEAGPARQRVGLLPRSRAPVRPGAKLLDRDGRLVGEVTSGGFGPTLGAPVAMGYVARDAATPGTLLTTEVRGAEVEIDVAALPAVPHRYRR